MLNALTRNLPAGKPPTRRLYGLVLLLAVSAGVPALAQSDLYIKDTPNDIGAEPNSDTGPMWVSEDIWVRRSPDPNYQATPFPEAMPSWTPLPHQDPEYRDPIFGVPNYVYVRIRNKGTSASTGTERLKVYWAKASTGLAWDNQWVDYLSNTCGPTQLYGAEITKPRKNAATATVAERNAYRDAILDIGTLPAFEFMPGSVSYWHKQDEVHQGGPSNRHGTPAFLPWHREFINRYEVLLQKADPTVKLLYWDWTTDPENSGGFNFFTPSFMGASGRGSGFPINAGVPFSPALNLVTRNLSSSVIPPADADSSLLANGTYPLFAADNEEIPNHNASHGYIGGGTWPNFGTMSAIISAAEDPFFFVLHANVDRLWAQWQRDPSNISRLEAGTAYGSNSSNTNITNSMGPWDGINGSSGNNPIDPWTPAGGQIYSKTPKHYSVVSPPIYDTAPLTIPALAPGEAVIVQIPWYPPDPADYSCFGPTDFDHFCLLARVETSTTAPFGMNTPETTSIYNNTRYNNNIAWKNISVVDDFSGPLGLIGFFVRNVHAQTVQTQLVLREAETGATPFLEHGRAFFDLGPKLFDQWNRGGAVGQNVRAVQGERNTVEVFGSPAVLKNIKLDANATYPVGVRFELANHYRPEPDRIPKWDIVQMGTPKDPNAIVGGNRYELDFRRLELVAAATDWQYYDQGATPDARWTQPDYDDSGWRTGRAPVGYGDGPATTIDAGPSDSPHNTAYFRHTFEVDRPDFYQDLMLRLRRDDGAVVYLNGTEIYRVNMPEGAPAYDTRATRDVKGLEEQQYFPVSVSRHLHLLNRGDNVVAVEVHQAAGGTGDLGFDLELLANNLIPGSPPDLRFESPQTVVQVGETVPIQIAAADPDPGGGVSSVAFIVGGRQVAQSDRAPHQFSWKARSVGVHRLRAIAKDNDGNQSSVDLSVSVVANAPPVATLTRPEDHSSAGLGETITLSAEAYDVAGGSVAKVEFYQLGMADIFTKPPALVGTVSEPPYTVDVSVNREGHFMFWALAIDDKGLDSQSYPAHVHVGDHGNHGEHKPKEEPATSSP